MLCIASPRPKLTQLPTMPRALREGEVRILHLSPYKLARSDAPIECSLQTAVLSDAPKYEAISYRWGSMKDTKQITIDGRPMQITKTLHDALQQIRSRRKKKLLWVDQLCIDQDNNEEKIQQVRMMDRIYETCTRCLIWFGQLDDSVPLQDAEAAFELLSYIAGARFVKTPAVLRDQATFNRTMLAISAMTVWKQAWWQRAWTLQEAVLPAEKVLLWGPLKLSWDVLEEAADVRMRGWPAGVYEALERYVPPETYSNAWNPLEDLLLHITWLSRTTTGKKNAYDVLLQIYMIWRGKRQSSNIRDLVFGFTGLCRQDIFENLSHCNYETPPGKLFAAATLDLVIGQRSLLPLVMAPRVDSEQKTPGIPSWAIDHKGPFTRTADAYFLYWGYHDYNACASTFLDPKTVRANLDHEFSPGYGGFELSGVIADEIVAVADSIIDYEFLIEPPTLYTMLAQWLAFAQKHTALPADAVKENFGRLLFGDFIRDGEQWPSTYVTTEQAHQATQAVVNKTTPQWLWCDPKLLWAQVCNQSLYITASGLLGMGDPKTKPGDEVWIFKGGNMPFTLRKLSTNADECAIPGRQFVAYTYVQGIMHGEFFMEIPESERDQKTFRPVVLK